MAGIVEAAGENVSACKKGDVHYQDVSGATPKGALEAHHTVDTLPEKLTLNKELPSASHVCIAYRVCSTVPVKAGGSVLGQVEELEEQHATWL